MTKIVRNMSTTESKNFWAKTQQEASALTEWPAWKRAGINVAEVRTEPRSIPATASVETIASPRGKR